MSKRAMLIAVPLKGYEWCMLLESEATGALLAAALAQAGGLP
jgi:hypothetical protein